jgi:hypothetical protein
MLQSARKWLRRWAYSELATNIRGEGLDKNRPIAAFIALRFEGLRRSFHRMAQASPLRRLR